MRSCFLVLQSQAPHAVHPLSQSFGLQAHSQGFFCFSNLSHFLPPHAAAFTIFSSRSCFPSVSPVLHSHAPHGCHSGTQGSSLQHLHLLFSSSFLLDGHSLPHS